MCNVEKDSLPIGHWQLRVGSDMCNVEEENQPLEVVEVTCVMWRGTHPPPIGHWQLRVEVTCAM